MGSTCQFILLTIFIFSEFSVRLTSGVHLSGDFLIYFYACVADRWGPHVRVIN